MRLTTSTRSSVVGRPAQQVWESVAAAGPGPHWYLDAAPLRLRGALDRLVGGEPLHRPPDRAELAPGDRVGFWRVSRAGHRVLDLVAEVRAPGSVLLRTAVFTGTDPGDDTSRVTQSVTFRPRGLAGTAYLLADLPAREVLIDLVHRRTVAEADG